MCRKQPRGFDVSTTRIALVAILILTLGVLSAPVLAQGAESGIDFQILDSATGFGVASATIKWGQIGQTSVAPLSQSVVSSPGGKVMLQLPPGEYAFEYSASGYKSMRGNDGVTSGAVVPLNVVLDPVLPPEELRKSTVDTLLRKGMELDHGFVSDALTHRPIAHAWVRLEQSGAAATTNSRGYFQLMAPAQDTSKLNSAQEFPPLDTQIVTAPGYKTYVLTGILHVPQSWTVDNIELTPGRGTTREDVTPVPLRPRGSSPPQAGPEAGPRPSPIPRFLLEWLSGHATSNLPKEEQPAPTATLLTNAIILPPNIRVGSNCSNGIHGFITTNTYALETYVQDGLDKEWIAAWEANSLDAGAVAYRSYGAWYVANPVCPTTGSSCPVKYDICDNTSCQVFNTNKPPSSTVAAAQATAGLVVSYDGIHAAKAYYAAHQDGGACPDGQIGDGTANWPCMSDPIAVGSNALFDGNNWGMSAWGSHWWARGTSYGGTATAKRDWRCILDHYYNANSNSITVDPTGSGNPGAGSGLRTAFTQGQPTYGTIAYEAENARTGAPTGIRGANAADGSNDYSIVSGFVFHPSWEPGGARLAYTDASGIAVVNADGTGNVQITSNGCSNTPYYCDFAPAWSPFTERIAFCSMRSGSTQIWVMNSDGSNLQQLTTSLSLGDTGYPNLNACLRRVRHAVCPQSTEHSGARHRRHRLR